jgi:hypothetical protein
MTASRLGCVVSSKTLSLVSGPAWLNPGMVGTFGRPPVAMTARANRKRAPSTSTVSWPQKRPWPKNTSTPSD